MAGREIIYCVFEHEETIALFCNLVKQLKDKGILLGKSHFNIFVFRVL